MTNLGAFKFNEAPTTGIVTSKPTSNVTRSSATLGSLSTPWTVTITATAGQVVRIEATIISRVDNDTHGFWAIAKGGTVLTKAITNYTAAGNRTSTTTAHWVDESPTVGSNTYEVYIACSGGTITVYGGNSQDTTTSITMSGNSVLTAETRVVGS